MEVIRNGDVERQDATKAPIFFGGEVFRQPLVAGGVSKHFNFSIVGFAAGARNKFHTHTRDQILFVTEGTGVVATEEQEVVVHVGDTILIRGGEKHWDGATADSDFAHISLTTPDSKTEIYD